MQLRQRPQQLTCTPALRMWVAIALPSRALDSSACLCMCESNNGPGPCCSRRRRGYWRPRGAGRVRRPPGQRRPGCALSSASCACAAVHAHAGSCTFARGLSHLQLPHRPAPAPARYSRAAQSLSAARGDMPVQIKRREHAPTQRPGAGVVLSWPGVGGWPALCGLGHNFHAAVFIIGVIN